MEKRTKPANTQKAYMVTKKQLPLSCPSDDMVIWNSHPRVFLPIEETKEETCPYCGAVYKLKES